MPSKKKSAAPAPQSGYTIQKRERSRHWMGDPSAGRARVPDPSTSAARWRWCGGWRRKGARRSSRGRGCPRLLNRQPLSERSHTLGTICAAGAVAALAARESAGAVAGDASARVEAGSVAGRVARCIAGGVSGAGAVRRVAIVADHSASCHFCGHGLKRLHRQIIQAKLELDHRSLLMPRLVDETADNAIICPETFPNNRHQQEAKPGPQKAAMPTRRNRQGTCPAAAARLHHPQESIATGARSAGRAGVPDRLQARRGGSGAAAGGVNGKQNGSRREASPRPPCFGGSIIFTGGQSSGPLLTRGAGHRNSSPPVRLGHLGHGFCILDSSTELFGIGR
jgi:hypothetical protein